LIDLHTHTDASDGSCTPAELVRNAAANGITVLSVTDHDTLAGCEPAAAACAGCGLEFVSGIEITTITCGIDVHVLGYFVDRTSAALQEFLAQQRLARIDRVGRMIERLRYLGMPLDREAILRPGRVNPAKAVGRPSIARALVEAGYVRTSNEAFHRWLASGRPAFVPRPAAAPEDVIALIHDAGGLASLAHPGVLGQDGWIPRFAAAGLDALEAYYPDHDLQATRRYLDLASEFSLAVSGGSDYHGGEMHGGADPGSVSLPLQAYERLKARPRSHVQAAGDPRTDSLARPPL
jgi:3',5'-nucleoside bisphosphate phosphatase